MTALLLIVFPGMVVGLGLALMVVAFLPAAPRLSAAVARMGSRTPAPSETVNKDDLYERIGGRLLRRFGDLPIMRVPDTDLRLIQMEPSRFITQKALVAALGFVLPFAAGVAGQAAGSVAFYIPGIFGIPLAIVGWMTPNWTVKADAVKARSEFTRAVAVYIELVASERGRGEAPTRSLENAATVGRSWVFVRIRQELTESRLAGVAAWDGLEKLAVEIDTPDLADLAKRMRLTGEEGANSYEALRAQGRSLRDRLLNEQHAAANRDTTLLNAPLAFVGFMFMAIIGTPFVMATFMK